MKKNYGTPEVVVLGTIEHLTQNNNIPVTTDVPYGTPVENGPIVGNNPPS